MATLKVILRKSTVAGKAGSIGYLLAHRKAIRQITAGIHLQAEQWDARQQKVAATAGKELAAIRHRIESDVAALRRIIHELDDSGRPYAVTDIVERFNSGCCQNGILAFFAAQIELLQAAGRLGTARNYQRTQTSFAAFLGGKEVAFSALTEELIDRYNAYLSARGVVRNTISFYMRILRAVYNKAVRQRLTEQVFPFQGVYTGIDRTRKRAVGEQVVARLNQLDLTVSAPLRLARDLFIFSYCMRGMAFVDLVYLRTANLRGEELVYLRRKTGQQLCVRVESCARKILARYAPQATSPYLFPVLTSTEQDKAFAQYQIALNYYNKQLKRLSKLLQLEHPLTSYTARHSWATAARNHRIPVSVISAGMGHTSERTTQIYLATLENSIIDSANQRIIRSLEAAVSSW